MCYRVLGRGEDFIVGMLRAVKVGFGGGAPSSDVQRFTGVRVNELEIKTGAGRSEILHARAKRASVLALCCCCAAGVCTLPVKSAVPTLVGC